ncbi:hypothetical protein MHYP_G00054360 [Metynnis hypsauchen]
MALNLGRNALIDKSYRWKFPIPYILDDSLDLNTKGVIFQAFEIYRLKSCVDFKPYEGEKSFIRFEKLDGFDDSFITDQNTPYDYESIMHYGPYSFNVDPRYPTITAKDPELTKALGQYNDFSSVDLLRLNRMYNCTAPLTLLDQCSFEALGICDMVQRQQESGARWVRSQSSHQSHDHTLVGQCRDAGHYMFFSTSSGKTAFLESRILYPKRKLQCLQVFYKIPDWKPKRSTGHLDKTGSGRRHPHWHSYSNTPCAVDEYIQSPRFYSPEGYGFGLQLLPNSYVDGYIRAFFHLTSGENDKALHWPAGNRQVTMTVLDQDPDVTQRQSFSYSFTTNGKQLIPGTDRFYWDDPSKVGTYDPSCDCYRGWTWGYNAFFSHFDLRRRSYLKNDDLILFIEFEELNAKGVILQALEMYRLKSCVDFKPYEGESTYISFTKLDGCWSFVGDLQTGQNISIGERCDTKAIVEHELLHALGFYHEQSRSDRDDYVQIWWDQITEGKEHNFNKYDDSFITDLNTPYDYESIMHYRPFSFNKDPDIPTITTAIPAFNEIIGQRLDFSAIDLERLNRMYDCAETRTLLDQCAFEQINICGMIQNENDNADWVQTLSSADGQDHTLGGQCQDAGYYMQFNTANEEVGHSALLESRILYPKRGYQCLQFFYRMTGGPGDQLVIWLRMDDGTGDVRKVRKVHTIVGDTDDTWNIAYVTLNVEEKFRYIFQGIVGSEKTSGAIFIDDIILSETTCPSAVWRIQKFTGLLESTPNGESVRSDCFYSSDGYGYGIDVYPNGRINTSADYVGVTFHLCSGESDTVLEWPAINRQATITFMDQDPDVTLQMSNSRSFTTDLTHLIKSEVPVQNKVSEESLAVEETLALVPKAREARAVSDPCQLNPCLNGGVCINNQGKASCRCPSNQISVFLGEICENQHINGGILGIILGGAAGTVALAVAIIVTIRRQH